MVRINYENIVNCPVCNAFMEEYIKNPVPQNEKCSNGIFSEDRQIMNIFQTHKCNAAMSFVSFIASDFYNFPREARCFYLYYWLYKEINAHNKSTIIEKNFYNLLFYSISNTDLCDYNKYNDITDDQISRLSDLYDMITNIYYIKTSNYPSKKNKCDCADECSQIYELYHNECEHSIDNNFCQALKNIKRQYNSLISLSYGCDTIRCKILPCIQNNETIMPSPRTNIKNTIITTTLLILAIPVFVFYTYKFNLYNYFIPHGGIRKNELRNYIDNELDVMEISAISNSMLKNSQRNIFYHTS
ncbi:variable surface protein [Plasmodium gonderi]|uniref:Variable surface protein n=1 Tax=Plasmodium gonderi TaxID=77519 RepID=A0A1Y1JSH1_PLAGO|nr:variable surface protein [Plasmodium gonderi]GAW84398.1 variable surface protein [Plasmodium gonderi]